MPIDGFHWHHRLGLNPGIFPIYLVSKNHCAFMLPSCKNKVFGIWDNVGNFISGDIIES